ncbi:MAG TPA: hypothetical protein VHE57_06580 [Mycobacteriales bacterium]|nr:hypothetical protein [Mycobacteriales bacterium]
MNRTTRAMARLGTLAVLAGTALSAPFAIGTASAAPLAASDVSTTNGNIGSIAEASNRVAYAGTMGAITLNTPGNPAAGDQVTIQLAGGDAYFVAGQPGGTSATTVTCTWNAAPNPAPTCAGAYAVGDDKSETVQVAVSDTTNGTQVNTTLGFNSLTISGCPTTGFDTATALAAPESTAVNCVTQGSFSSPLTLTAQYLAGGAGVVQNTTVTLTTPGAAQFSGSQPADGGCLFFTTTVVQCTSGADGNFKFTIVDSGVTPTPTPNVDTSVIQVSTRSGTGSYPQLTAGSVRPTEQINWAPGSVTPARVDLTGLQVIAPSAQATNLLAEPGDVIQATFKVMGSCPLAAGNATCDNGTALSGQSVTVKTDHGFITPNCTVSGVNGYAECSFSTAPAKDAPVGNLTSSGQSATFTTKPDGTFVASFGIGRDEGFDAAGLVASHITVADLPVSIVGDHTTAQTCPTSTVVQPRITGPAVVTTTPAAAPTFPGCSVDLGWTTKEQPLNGGTAKINVVPSLSSPNNVAILTENNDDATTGTTAVNVPDVDRVVFKVALTDQFGNLTSNAGATGNNIAQLFKTGPGKLWNCGAAFNTTDACSATGNGGRFTNAQQADGTFNEAFAAVGSYTNVGAQNRYQADTAQNGAAGGNAGFGSETPSVNDGTTTIVLSWTPPTTTFSGTGPFWTFTAGNGTAVTDTLTLNFYNQLAQPVVTFDVSPGNTVPTATAVTVTATTVDQHGHPIVSIPGVTTTAVQVVRSGANESTCTPIQNAANQILGSNTSGVTGYTFSCDAAGVSNVSMVITGPGGVQLAQGREAITFTGQAIGGGLKTEKPTLRITAPKRHVLVLHAATHPSLVHVKVHFYKVRHGLKLLVGADRTGAAGHAHLRIKHLKSGTHPKYTAKVVGLSDKFKSKYAKAHKHRVR